MIIMIFSFISIIAPQGLVILVARAYVMIGTYS